MSWRPLLVLLAFAACAAPAVAVVLSPTTFGPAPALPGHFFDANGLSLASYELAWPVLVETFGSSLPARVTVDYEAKGTSQFDPGRNAVHIARDSIHSSSEGAVVAHETAHLGLANLTAGASTTEPFRFLDEGLATIIEKKVGGALDHYKSTTLALAAGRLANGSVKLDDLQRWSQYFGDPKVGADFNAYDVGAAFVFFLQDNFGEAVLRQLLIDIGRSRSLGVSLRASLGRTSEETEVCWESCLRRVDVHVPAVVELSPRNGEASVAADLREIHATFDSDMQPAVCIRTDCNDGICYDHAAWRDAHTLVVTVSGALLPAHAYALSLGIAGRCRLRAQAGAEAPVVTWEFRTR
jgi:hypothetical protein